MSEFSTSKQQELKNNRIKLLDNRLANQIAAGEVVERPASVVKELMENCIDARASKIEVDIERGGTRLIRITDNGKGIHKEDLALSLTRHATSKIQTTEDLACIQSLGFRGEALASISAVSKLTLTSRTHDSELAWQAVAQGRDMSVEILPAAAATGTRIEVADLFFNTPARQKFLRAEKTEFNHIEEVFKRHALANFQIAFVLKHNHKVVKRVPACGETSQYLKRIATICGKGFADNCIPFKCSHESVHLSGWLGKPNFHRSESDIQYVFINGRPVKDKTLNHAIRQAYEGLLPAGRMATYVVFLAMDPTEVDVNVHPTKHEVRFGEQRLVHDLLAKSIADSLADCETGIEVSSEMTKPEIETGSNNRFELQKDPVENFQFESYYNKPPKYFARKKADYQNNSPIKSQQRVNEVSINPLRSSEAFSRLENNRANASSIFYVGEEFCITSIDNTPIVVNANILLKAYLEKLLSKVKIAESKSLLFPKAVILASDCLEEFEVFNDLHSVGFVCEPIVKNKNQAQQELLIKRVPVWLSQKDSVWLFERLPFWLESRVESQASFIEHILNDLQEDTQSLVALLIQEMNSELLVGNSCKVLTTEQMQGLFK